MFQVGDVVRLKAGGENMTVAEVKPGGDGNGGDGHGVRCLWFTQTTLRTGWFSETSLEKVEGSNG